MAYFKNKFRLKKKNKTQNLDAQSVADYQGLQRCVEEVNCAVNTIPQVLDVGELINTLHTANQQWMEKFLSQGGLSALFDALEAMDPRESIDIAGVCKRLKWVASIKAALNQKFHLKFITSQPRDSFLKKITKGG